jgi:bla regulator protein blaR1
LNEGFNQKSYQITLLEHLIGSASLSITNNFNYSLIKNRIAMMNKEKLSKKNNWKIFLIIPISLLLVLAFACTKKSDSDTSALKKSSDSEIAYYETEQMADFDGGLDGARRFIAKNIKYPDLAKENGVSAKIMVIFVVDKNGNINTDVTQFITDRDEKVSDGVVVAAYGPENEENSSTDEKYLQLLKDEALRVVKMLPVKKPAMKDGKPVNSIYTFPINFVLQ